MTQPSSSCRENKQWHWSAQWRWKCVEGGEVLGAGRGLLTGGSGQGSQKELTLLACFFFLFSAPLSPAGDCAGLQHWSSLITAPAGVTKYHGGCNTKGSVLTGRHGWAGLAFKQWERSSTKALPPKTAEREAFTHSHQAAILFQSVASYNE